MKLNLIYLMTAGGGEGYPRLLHSHPRNRAVDWRALGAYAQSGQPGDLRVDIFVKPRSPFDTVNVTGRAGVLFSERLRAALEPVIGGPVEFLPVGVNGQPFWIMRLGHFVDALDWERSEYELTEDGGIQVINRPCWIGDRISDPSMFQLPQYPWRIWATPAVVAAYRASGCLGLTFGPRGEVI